LDVAALRNVEKRLGLEKLYVLGTNCGKSAHSSIFVSFLLFFLLLELQNFYGRKFVALSGFLAAILCLFAWEHIVSRSSELNYVVFVCMPVDNGPREGLDKFLKAASDDPDTVLHYEFMQDYKVLHLKRYSTYVILLQELSDVASFPSYRNFASSSVACGGFSSRPLVISRVVVDVNQPGWLLSTGLLLFLCRFTSSIWMVLMRR
jgi:hypothetical protein